MDIEQALRESARKFWKGIGVEEVTPILREQLGLTDEFMAENIPFGIQVRAFIGRRADNARWYPHVVLEVDTGLIKFPIPDTIQTAVHKALRDGGNVGGFVHIQY